MRNRLTPILDPLIRRFPFSDCRDHGLQQSLIRIDLLKSLHSHLLCHLPRIGPPGLFEPIFFFLHFFFTLILTLILILILIVCICYVCYTVCSKSDICCVCFTVRSVFYNRCAVSFFLALFCLCQVCRLFFRLRRRSQHVFCQHSLLFLVPVQGRKESGQISPLPALKLSLLAGHCVSFF